MGFLEWLNTHEGGVTVLVLAAQLALLAFQLVVMWRQGALAKKANGIAENQSRVAQQLAQIEARRHAREGPILRAFVVDKVFENDLVHNKVRRRFWDVVLINEGERATLLNGFTLRLGPPFNRLATPNLRVGDTWQSSDETVLILAAQKFERVELRWMPQNDELDNAPAWIALLAKSPEGTVSFVLDSPDTVPDEAEVKRIGLAGVGGTSRPLDLRNHSMRDRIKPGSREELLADHRRRWPKS